MPTYSTRLHLVSVLEVPNMLFVQFVLVAVIQKPELFLAVFHESHSFYLRLNFYNYYTITYL